VDEIATAQSGATWTTCTVDTGADKPLRGVVKWDKTGRIGFAVGVTAEPGKIGRIVGVVHGCVAVADQIHRNVDVWDNDGLWVGQFLENPDFAIAPRPAYRLAPGFIDGSVYVDPHSDNVYFVGRGVNNDPILRIDGWSGWDQQDGMVALR